MDYQISSVSQAEGLQSECNAAHHKSPSLSFSRPFQSISVTDTCIDLSHNCQESPSNSDTILISVAQLVVLLTSVCACPIKYFNKI